MKEAKSSLWLYVSCKYFFGFMLVVMVLGTIDGFLQEGTNFEYNDSGLLKTIIILGVIFLFIQIIALRFVVRATVNKEAIKFNNGVTMKWDNVKFINRISLLYILKTKDNGRYYLFPTESQAFLELGERIEDTDMDQIINLKTVD